MGLNPSQRPSVAPVSEKFSGVRRIAVLRGGGIGDLLFSLPAIEALRGAYPDAHITLLGSPVHAELLGNRAGAPHEVEVLPVSRGVRPGELEDARATARFINRMRARRFDLAVQVHGGGRFSNPFLLKLGARHTIGTRTPDAAELERSLPYTYYQHEVLRSLEVVGLAGAAPVTLEPKLEVTDRERDSALSLVDPLARALLVVHPGATDARRRWLPERFAEVAGPLAASGVQIIVVGDASDSRIANDIVGRVLRGIPPDQAGRVSSLAGKLTLPELVGLLSCADVLLGNDSGPRHLAQALGAKTVAVYWFGNLINAGPLGRENHRVHLSWTTRCPVCDRDCTQVGWTSERCEHDVSFVADVAAGPVGADVSELLRLSGTREPIQERSLS